MTTGVCRMGHRWFSLSLKLNDGGLLVCLGALLVSSTGISDVRDDYLGLQDVVISL